MKTYHLYVQFEGVWHWVGNVHGTTYDEAHQKAVASLDPQYYDKPMRLDYDHDAPSNQHESKISASLDWRERINRLFTSRA